MALFDVAVGIENGVEVKTLVDTSFCKIKNVDIVRSPEIKRYD